MKSLNSFVVYVPKRYNDEIKTKSGLKLYLDTKFQPFENRINEGEVVSVPAKFKTGVEVGDTLYFHHLVILEDGQPLPVNDDHYVVRYDPVVALNCQAICYKSKKDGKVYPLSTWSILEHVEQEKTTKSDVIEVIEVKEREVKTAKVAFDSEGLKTIGVKKGDIVGILKDSDYPFTIDGNKLYRTRTRDLMYIEA
jgi:co-chaperonin GroES (HSP10)